MFVQARRLTKSVKADGFASLIYNQSERAEIESGNSIVEPDEKR